MTELDFERLQPLRVAVGSHPEGSGFGCAMNIVSYITGDVEITDYPACAHHDLARMVQRINDYVGMARGGRELSTNFPTAYAAVWRETYTLAPEDAVRVVNLGCMTIGTSHVDLAIVYRALFEVVYGDARFEEISDASGYLPAPAGFVERLKMVDYPADVLMEFGEKVLTRVRELAGLDVAEEVTLPEGVLL